MNAQKFIVRRPGSYAVKFHHNACGAQASAVVDQDASTFDSPETARTAALAHNMRDGQFTVEPKPETTNRK